MAFELPTHKETLSAIGSTNALPGSLKRALSIDDFEPIPIPGPNDWLAEHYEDGQTHDEFIQSDRRITLIHLHSLLFTTLFMVHNVELVALR